MLVLRLDYELIVLTKNTGKTSVYSRLGILLPIRKKLTVFPEDPQSLGRTSSVTQET